VTATARRHQLECTLGPVDHAKRVDFHDASDHGVIKVKQWSSRHHTCVVDQGVEWADRSLDLIQVTAEAVGIGHVEASGVVRAEPVGSFLECRFVDVAD
jgi:hypothetical protein